jgi:hypothetical protein
LISILVSKMKRLRVEKGIGVLYDAEMSTLAREPEQLDESQYMVALRAWGIGSYQCVHRRVGLRESLKRWGEKAKRFLGKESGLQTHLTNRSCQRELKPGGKRVGWVSRTGVEVMHDWRVSPTM